MKVSANGLQKRKGPKNSTKLLMTEEPTPDDINSFVPHQKHKYTFPKPDSNISHLTRHYQRYSRKRYKILIFDIFNAEKQHTDYPIKVLTSHQTISIGCKH